MELDWRSAGSSILQFCPEKKKATEEAPSQSFETDGDQLKVMLELETMEKLYRALLDQDDGAIFTPKHFADILQETILMEEDVAMQLFEKIDWTSVKKVSWGEFCGFMRGEFKIHEAREELRKQVNFVFPAPLTPLPHRDGAVKVLPTMDGLWITISTEGTVALWDNKARLKRRKLCLSKQRLKKKQQKQWITDSVLMTEYSKVIIATGDREIQFFDMASFSPFCQINGLESIPICICYRPVKVDKCVLIYGDQMGCVCVLIFHSPWKSFRLWKKLHKHEDYIPSIPIEQAMAENHISFMRWHVHKDWVLKVDYCYRTDQIISCSKDPEASLVIGKRRGSTNVAKMRKEGDPRAKKLHPSLYGCTQRRQPHDQIVFSLLRGVAVFDYSCDLKMVATGGADRTIRLWNVYMHKKPESVLTGHYDIIRYLLLDPPRYRLFSASADRWVKVWDVVDFTCKLTVPWNQHLVIGELKAFNFSPVNNSLAVVGDNGIAILKIKTDEDSVFVRSHQNPVKCIIYSPLFNKIISASNDSTVRLWNLSTGRKEMEIHKAHGEAGIADMALDSSMKRLITVATDGTAKMWNYNTGQHVRNLQPAPGRMELTTVAYVDMRNVRYILTGGWNRRINMYVDDTPETIPFEIPLLAHWRDDEVRGHTSDILCSDFSQRDKVATGDFNGQVLVWNVDTGCRIHALRPPPPEGWSEEKLADDKGVTCLHFLKLRSKQRRWGNLVVGGPYGHVTIWNVSFAGGPATAPLASFPVSEENTDREVVSVTALDSDEDNTILVTANRHGNVTLWDLDQYALEQPEDQPPKSLASWTAHLKRVTGVKLVTKRNLVVSCSIDHTVRLWTCEGHYIGTFGQKQAWHVDEGSTYMHPLLPSDISEFFGSGQPTDEEVDEMEKTMKQSEDVEHVVPVRRRDSDPFQIGLNYFARKKACISKKGRHLNDETFRLYSLTGHVVPYKNLRHHSISPPPEVHDHFKNRTADMRTRQMRPESSYFF